MNLSMKKRVWRWECHLHCRRKTDRCLELGINICMLVLGSIINNILPQPSPCPLVLLQTEQERVWSSQWQTGKSQLLIQWEICCGRMRWCCQWKVGEGSLLYSSKIIFIQTQDVSHILIHDPSTLIQCQSFLCYDVTFVISCLSLEHFLIRVFDLNICFDIFRWNVEHVSIHVIS